MSNHTNIKYFPRYINEISFSKTVDEIMTILLNFLDSLLIQFDGKTISAVYNYSNDPLLLYNIANQVDIAREEEFLKAYIQQYIYRLTTNQLTIETNGSSSR